VFLVQNNNTIIYKELQFIQSVPRIGILLQITMLSCSNAFIIEIVSVKVLVAVDKNKPR
jgi:hypothetical protein